jgi:hypothetical protein
MGFTQSILNPYGLAKKKAASRLTEQAPYLVGCLSCFQLYLLMVEKVNVFIDDLFGFFKHRGRELVQSFFFEMSEEVFHGGVIPTIPRLDMEGVMWYCCSKTR